MINQKTYFENLDGLRFVLAAVVFFSHSMLGSTLRDLSPWSVLDNFISVFTTGALGVSFFFVLSGFLITYLIIEESEIERRFHLGSFYVRRIFRIWPLYFIVLIISFYIYPFAKSWLGYLDHNPHNVIWHIFFLANFDSIRVYNEGLVDVSPMMININWSIAIEEQFYLVWPLLFLMAPRSKFVYAIVFVIGASLICQLFFLSGIAQYYHTLAVVSDMAIGGFFAYLCFYSVRFRTTIKNLKKTFIVPVYISGIALLMYPTLVQSLNIPERFINAMFFSFVIIEQCYCKNSIFKFGKSELLSENGKYTYSFYLLHPLGIQLALLLFRFMEIERAENAGFGLLYTFMAFVFTAPLCWLTYRFVESYFLKKRKELFFAAFH